jgi:alpha-tubulin suppressor-like RCC1 family protein
MLDECTGGGEDVQFIQLADGSYHSCGLTPQGAAYCWGRDDYGQLGDGGVSSDSQSPVAVDTSSINGEKAFVQLTGGVAHSCGLTADGRAYCWGWDERGQLGNGGSGQDSQEPVLVDVSPITGEQAFVHLAAGGGNTCGLTSEGAAYCWGGDVFGELGNGGVSSNSQDPVAVDISPISGAKTFRQLTGGDSHVCGLTSDRVAYCWGSDSAGQLGDGGTSVNSQSPVAVDISPITGDQSFVLLAAGDMHTCGLTCEGATYCWGWDGYGQLGDGDPSNDSQEPVAVDTGAMTGDVAFVQLIGGNAHACGLTAAGEAYCWGRDDNGQLGDGGESRDSQSPVSVDTSGITGEQAFVQLTGGMAQSCGLTGVGMAYCWGWDGYGQLGDGGESNDSQSPVMVDTSAVAGGKSFVLVVTGYMHSCGLTSEGVVFCWGNDTDGQLGNGSTAGASQSPMAVDTVPITGQKAFVDLTVGQNHSCGLTAEGVAYCWGTNWWGQLGNGTSSNKYQSPEQVDTTTISGEQAFVHLTGGGSHTCGLTAEGAAYCWGADMYGQLGNGDAIGFSSFPSALDTSSITGSIILIHLSCGFAHCCGLTSEAVAYCWGYNNNGQLGDGSGSTQSHFPVAVDTSPVTGERIFVQLTVGSYHACGLTSEGVAYCWGQDDSGQLGDGGDSSNSSIPVAVDTGPIAGEKAFTKLSAGSGHTCGLTSAGVAYCWGSDQYGALGDGGNTNHSQSPVAVDTHAIAGEDALVQLEAAFSHSCGLTAEGVAYCWGEDMFGQLGDGGASNNSQSPVPVDISPL